MLESSKKVEVLIMEQSSNDTNNQQVRQMNLAWLAGIWEGEGSFSIVNGGKNRWFPRASVINTDFMLIEEIAAILKANEIGHYIQTRHGGCDGDPRHKDAKVIQIYGTKRVDRFVELLLPFLRAKKKEVAAEVLAYTKRRLELGKSKARYDQVDLQRIEKIRALNKKGPSVTSETTRQPSLDNASEDIVQVVSS